MDEDLSSQFEANRPRLQSVAYRMLGPLTEAEDAVQETWIRLNRSDAQSIDNLGSWLTTVLSRVCLGVLHSRRTHLQESLTEQHESGPELDGPEEEALIADAVGPALLFVLETLSPSERLAFVRHDLFAVPFEHIAPIVGRSPAAARQLASRARRRVQGGDQAHPGDRRRQQGVVEAFLAASRRGEFEALVTLLDPDAVLRADRAVVRAATANRAKGRAPPCPRSARPAPAGVTLGAPASDNHIVVTPRPRVVVVGAGFGGLAAVRGLAGAPVDVTVVDQDNYHGFWPLLYQVASSELAPEDIAAPIRAMMSGRSDVEVRLGTVEQVDLDGRRVCLAGGTELRFDYLIVAGGTVTSDFGIPGVSAHAYTLKTLPDAVRLRNHVLRAFERADALAAGSGTPPSRPVTVVVAGGGSTGVEMAGALAELIRHNLAGDFRHLDLSRARVVLVEMTDHLLPGFSPKSQAAAAATLHRLGVDVRLSTSIATVEPDGVTVTPRGGGSPERIEADTVVWTAGVRANPLGACLAGDLKWGGRVPVEADLTLPGHPEVFVVGDMAAATDRHGQPLPQVAQVAIQGGRHAARCIARRLGGRPTRRFRYHDHGSMATIGRRSAVAELPGGLVVTGTAGWLAWLGVHLVFLVGFRKRALVLATWAWNYITWDRASRVIMETRDRSA